MSSVYKKCPRCSSCNVVRNGYQSGRRRFKCKDCGKKFQSRKQSKRNNLKIIEDLVFKKNHIQN